MKWIDIELGGTMMWLREDSKARILAENLHAGSPAHARIDANTNIPGYATPSPRFSLTKQF